MPRERSGSFFKREKKLFISGRALAREVAEAMRAGADGYLVKPDDISQLTERGAGLIASRC